MAPNSTHYAPPIGPFAIMAQMSPDNPEIRATINLLSAITELPVTALSVFPQAVMLKDQRWPSADPSLTFRLELGEGEYALQAAIKWSQEYDPGCWLPTTSWNVSRGPRTIFDHGQWTNVTGEISAALPDAGILMGQYATGELPRLVGGPTAEVPFMDFERVTLAGLEGDDNYFVSAYLALMVDMKERGWQMPPILGKRPEIAQAMRSGDMATLEARLAAALIFEGTQLPPRCQAHMQLEAQEIRARGGWEMQARDPEAALVASFPWLQSQTIESGRQADRPYNILVVEGELGSNELTTEVIAQLETDGRFGGTAVIRQVNLPDCMALCRTGKIDVVLFDSTDWRSLAWEVLHVQTDRNPLFDMLYGNTRAVIDFGEDEPVVGLGDGRVLSSDQLAAAAEKLDIRRLWMNRIEASCREAKVEPPEYFVFRSQAELPDASKIISQKLRLPLC